MILANGSPLASLFAQQAGPSISPWVLVVVFILLVVLFVWLLLQWQAAKPPKQEIIRLRQPEQVMAQPSAAVPPPPAPFEPPARQPETVMAAPEMAPVAVVDDLEIIEGIGPKIAAVLKQAGITSFRQLAALQPEQITEILQAAGVRLADPRSWPEQARLAAAGDQAGLTALQDRLKGGREVV